MNTKEVVLFNEDEIFRSGKLVDAAREIQEWLAKVPPEYRNEAFIRVSAYECYGAPTVEARVGYCRPLTAEEEAARAAK